MQQNDEKDWIVRQVKAFAQGLGYILGHGKGNPGTEIVFPAIDAGNLPYQKELQELIDKREFQKSEQRLRNVCYSMEDEKFKELSKWFYQSFAEFSEQELS